MRMKRLFILSLLMCALLVSQANATTVTFDDADSNSILNQMYGVGSSFSISGLTFTANGAGPLMYIWDPTSPNSNGTNALIFGFSGSDYLSITKTGGGAFDLDSFDMSISWYNSNVSEEVLVNGSPITIGQGLQTYAFDLDGFTELQITGVPSGAGYWLLDNLNYDNASPVPEPSTFLLLGLGFAGVGLVSRKARK